MDRAVVILSGGMDSGALLHMAFDQFCEVHALTFDYGQRHRKEIKAAKSLVDNLASRDTGAYIWHDVISLKAVTPFLKGSALTDNVDVPQGHYTEDAARITVVPNRNMMMLSVAIAAAVAEEADVVYTGVHAGDHFVYPDCRPGFIRSVSQTAVLANEGFAKPGFHVAAPFLHMEKSEIVKVGERYGTPWQLTWSCYQGGARACGTCPTCVERLEAFYIAGVRDPLQYQDRQYWLTKTQIEGIKPCP